MRRKEGGGEGGRSEEEGGRRRGGRREEGRRKEGGGRREGGRREGGRREGGREEEGRGGTYHKHEFVLIVHLELESDSSMIECIGTPTLLRRQEREN